MIYAKWADYRLFDYELTLGKRELESLSNSRSDDSALDGLAIADERSQGQEAVALVERLRFRSTYFASVSTTKDTHPTAQAVTEALHWSLRDGAPRRRQGTRFRVHGLHEYRGKFNPQMARALVNVVDPEAVNLLDPFCGSGTTLVEGSRLGLDVWGIDQSPIAHFIAAVKVEACLTVDLIQVARKFAIIRQMVREAMKVAQDSQIGTPPHWLSPASDRYLKGWFTRPALAALYAGLNQLSGLHEDLAERLAAMCISSIVRQVSLQLPEDLRVRRRTPGFVAPSLAEAFDAAGSKVELMLDELLQGDAPPTTTGHVLLGTSGDEAVLRGLSPKRRGRRLIVTSPPYATALPYIDTDRLSLIALGLAEPPELRQVESVLVGSREWSKPEASRWVERRSANSDRLPADVMNLLTSIEELNRATSAGFRRAAVPALLYRYFSQMGDCFDAWRSFLRPGERAVLVVGRNRTGPRGQQIAIDTPELLGAVARTRGYDFEETMVFETWPRFGLHGSNGVSGEDAIVLARR
jgi:hypothetical protein